MEFEIDRQLWHRLLHERALRVPEEGNPREKARQHWQQEAAQPGGAAAASGGSSAAAAAAPAAPSSIDRCRASELSYAEFVAEYMEPNRPVLIEGATEGWRAVREWVLPGGGLDLEFLAQRFGSAKVVATDTAREHEGCGPQHNMSFLEFLHWWQARRAASASVTSGTASAAAQAANTADPAVAATGVVGAHPSSRAAAAIPPAAPPAGAGAAAAAGGVEGAWHGSKLLYVKDFHFAQQFPAFQAYTCPPFFADDWLNEWYDTRRAAAQEATTAGGQQGAGEQGSAARQGQVESVDADGVAAAGGQQRAGGDDATSDYRFVYVGPKGTWTPLHSDVLRSHSWSANVAGRKRWRLLAPQHTHLLYDRGGREMAPDFEVAGEDGQEGEAARFPGLAEARARMIEFVQKGGEAVFVPSGWYHSVENIEDTLSINHNWLNGFNVHWLWHLVAREREEAAAAIDDCRELCSPPEFEALVQRNMALNCGLDFALLGEFMRCIAERSMAHLAACPCAVAERQAAATAIAGSSKAASSAPPDTCCACCGWLPACCAQHAFRLQRAGLVLQQLVREQERILRGYAGTACSARGLGLEDENGQQLQQPQQQEVAANRGCLAAAAAALGGAGLPQLAVWHDIKG